MRFGNFSVFALVFLFLPIVALTNSDNPQLDPLSLNELRRQQTNARSELDAFRFTSNRFANPSQTLSAARVMASFAGVSLMHNHIQEVLSRYLPRIGYYSDTNVAVKVLVPVYGLPPVERLLRPDLGMQSVTIPEAALLNIVDSQLITSNGTLTGFYGSNFGDRPHQRIPTEVWFLESAEIASRTLKAEELWVAYQNIANELKRQSLISRSEREDLEVVARNLEALSPRAVKQVFDLETAAEVAEWLRNGRFSSGFSLSKAEFTRLNRQQKERAILKLYEQLRYINDTSLASFRIQSNLRDTKSLDIHRIEARLEIYLNSWIFWVYGELKEHGDRYAEFFRKSLWLRAQRLLGPHRLEDQKRDQWLQLVKSTIRQPKVYSNAENCKFSFLP